MASRTDFHALLETFCPNVYFQPPSNFNMQYPAIVYTRKNINIKRASSNIYKKDIVYNVTVMDRNPDSIIVEQLLSLKYCEFDRQFIVDGLYNISLNIYY